MYRIITACVALISLLLILPIPTHAVEIQKDWAFIDNRSGDIFGFNGLYLNLDVIATDPGGYNALTVSPANTIADPSNVSFSFSDPVTFSNANDHYPISGGAEFTKLLPLDNITHPISSVTGTYTYTVTNTSSESDVSVSHNLDKTEVIQTPTNLTFSDQSTTPLFTFIDPDPAHISELNRYYMVEIFDASYINIFQSDLSLTPSFDFDLFTSVTLEPGETYYFRAQITDFDPADFGGPDAPHSNLENRAIAYATLQTAVPEPATMLLLGSGLIGLAGFARKKFFKK